MKRIAIITVLIAVSAIALHAQRIGIRGGVTFDNSKIGYANVDKEHKTGFDGGLTLDFGLPLLGWNINTGVSYANRGFSLKHDRGINDEGLSVGETYHFTTHSLEVPLNLRKQFNLIAVKPFVQAGVYGSYIFSGRVKDPEASHSMKFENDSDKLAMGANIGVGCTFVSKICFLANYSLGFNKNKCNFGGETLSYRNKACTLSLGYLF
ncbi:MAG: porin family protein [Dysgonomonas sp.]|nr:porin family protein [Dysgonomonas sp.]